MTPLPTALYITVHKGASTFIAAEYAYTLGELFPDLAVVNLGNEIIAGKSYEDVAVPPTGAAYIRVYPQDLDKMVAAEPSADAPFTFAKMVLLRRDPRDAAISLYHSKARSHGTNVRNPEKLLAERAELVEMGVYEGVLAKTGRQTMREFKIMNEIIERYPHALVTNYEDLVTDYRSWLGKVGTYLEWPEAVIEDFHARTAHSFQPPEAEDPGKHKRRITPGNWREIDTPELRGLYDRLGGDALAAAGYSW